MIPTVGCLLAMFFIGIGGVLILAMFFIGIGGVLILLALLYLRLIHSMWDRKGEKEVISDEEKWVLIHPERSSKEIPWDVISRQRMSSKRICSNLSAYYLQEVDEDKRPHSVSLVIKWRKSNE